MSTITMDKMARPEESTSIGSPRLVLRFALLTALALVLAGGCILWFVRHEAAVRAEKQVGFHARFVADSILRDRFRESDFAGPVTGNRRAELDALFRGRILGGGTKLVKLWGRDGRVTYSSAHALIGETADSPEELERALAGETVAEESRLEGEPPGESVEVLEAYVPMRLSESGAPVGVFELYQDYGVVSQTVAATVKPITIALALALLALWASLFPILRRVTRVLRSRNRRLLEQAAALEAGLGELRRTDAALRASEERYRELFENANDVVATFELDGRFTSVNRAGEQVTGYGRDELLGMRFVELVVPEDVERTNRERERKLTGAVTTTEYEVEIVTKDGRRAALDVSSRLIEQDGRAVAIHAIARDVSERKELEERLRQSQKMEAVGQLAGGIAHDFNNLLTAIQGYAELLSAGLEGQSTPRRDAEEIAKAAERASALTRQLLAFSRRELVRPKPVDVNQLVTGIETLLHRTLGEQIKLQSNLSVDVAPVKADPGQLEQVLVNLAVNARDAMPTGGILTIETSNVTIDERRARRQGDVGPGRYVCLSVSDTGRGMSEEVRERAFEPFFTTKERGQGTGLGLATIYGIATGAGGHVVLDSEEGHGTTVTVYLPAGEYEARPSRPELAEAVPASGGSETVLVVEDEEAVRELAARVLGAAGYDVLTAGSGEEALALSESRRGPLDLVLSDVVLPGVSGRELVEHLSPARPGLCVIYMSGYTDDVVVRHAALEGVAFLGKPFRAEELLRRVRETLDLRPDLVES